MYNKMIPKNVKVFLQYNGLGQQTVRKASGGTKVTFNSGDIKLIAYEKAAAVNGCSKFLILEAWQVPKEIRDKLLEEEVKEINGNLKLREKYLAQAEEIRVRKLKAEEARKNKPASVPTPEKTDEEKEAEAQKEARLKEIQARNDERKGKAETKKKGKAEGK